MSDYSLRQRQVAAAVPTDPVNEKRKTLVWVGSPDHDDVAAAFAFCTRHFPQIAVRSNLQDFADFPADQVSDLIVVRCDRRNPPDCASGLLEQLPMSRFWTLSSSECEGEVRTGNPWVGFEHIYWHRWNQVLPTWFENIATSKLNERKTIVLLSRDIEMAADLCEWLAKNDHAVFCFADPNDAKVFNVDICIWDDSVAPPTSLRSWQQRLAKFDLGSRFVVKHVWLAGFPRIQHWRTAQAAGVFDLISKPFHLSAFSYILNQYREALHPLETAGKKVSDPFCAKHPKGRFPAKGVGHFFSAQSLGSLDA